MDAPSIVAFVATTILACLGLSPSPNSAGIVGLLVMLQLYPKVFSRKASQFTSPWVASTIGAAMSHTRAASDALHVSILSAIILVVLSAVTSAIPIAAIYIDAQYIGKNHRYNWSRLAAFPAFWASTWGVISILTPAGRLLTWSPVTGLGPYAWISPYLGPWGIDFIVAAWSVVLTEFITIPRALLKRDPEDPRNVENVTPYADDPEEVASRDRSTFYHKSAFTIFLLALVLPSLWTPGITNPTYTSTTTPFTLGCALPQTHLPHTEKPRRPTLDDYIKETRKMTSAKLVLWPEGSIKFETEEHRNETLGTIFDKLLKDHKGFHLGVGFEEVSPGSRKKRASTRNGFALLVDDRIVLQYYKRNLVPIAESFSITPGDEEPKIYELPLGPPSGTHKPDWAEAPGYTRPIPVTSSICLDFASQSSFLSLDSQPALILAPARTWHPSVGLGMWDQARQRAHETGSTILWCDGGEGGLSGIIGGGFEEPLQFGEGSWTKTIGITYPFLGRKTTFMWAGNLGGFLVVWMLAGGGFVIQATATVLHTPGSLLAWNVVRAAQGFSGLLHRNRPNDAERGEGGRLIEDGREREATLLDLDDDELEEPHRQQTPTYGTVQRA